MPKTTWYNWCDFGQHMISKDADGKRSKMHVYPVPVCKAFPNGGYLDEGATSCLRHYPRIRKLQIKQGLVIIGTS